MVFTGFDFGVEFTSDCLRLLEIRLYLVLPLNLALKISNFSDKDINIRFNDYSTNSGGLSETEYAQISGDREFDVKHPSIQKLNPIVDQVSVYHKPNFDKELGNKMYKDVEEKQMPKH